MESLIATERLGGRHSRRARSVRILLRECPPAKGFVSPGSANLSIGIRSNPPLRAQMTPESYASHIECVTEPEFKVALENALGAR